MPPDRSPAAACQLRPADRPQRSRDFQGLFAGSFADRTRAPGLVAWRLLYSPSTERESRRLADLERRCCDGLTFEVGVEGDFVVWTIRAAEEGDLLDLFYEFPVLMQTDEGADAVWSRLDAHACWRNG